MVAKISYGSSLYGALAYNGEKVNEGVARILETNKVFCPADGGHDITDCMQDFLAYMPSQVHTKKPVIHISLNPHPELSVNTPQGENQSTSQTLPSEENSVLGGLLDLPLEAHGTDWEEEQFRRRMQRKKRKQRKL